METELSLTQCRLYLIGVLKHVDDFCRENGIQYSLGYGSLIGAIRHKGFIPWDDDIDIIMTRENYDKFIELHFLKTQEKGRYRVRCGGEIANHLHAVVSDEETFVTFRKGTTDDIFYQGGVWVDLFPMDHVESEVAYNTIWKRIYQLRKLQILAEAGALPWHRGWKKLLRNILHPLLSPFARKIGRLADAEMKKTNHRETKFLASFAVWYWKQRVIPKSLFDDYIEVEFEGLPICVIKGYDVYLRGLYGDYMKYPPIEQRVPKHKYQAFKKNLS